MASPLEMHDNLATALVNALDSYESLEEILADLAATGEIGRAIHINLQRSNALKTDCKRLIRLSWTYEKDLACLRSVLQLHLQQKHAWPALQQALIAYTSPVQSIASPSAPAVVANVYISYAWGDPSPEGQRRGRLVDQLCDAIKGAGIPFHIDREEVKSGDRISAFMNAITKGDVIIIILSKKYLESEYCMYELSGIWKENSQDPERFLGRVIPLTLPDAKLNSTEDLIKKTQYWSEYWQRLDQQMSPNLRYIAPEIFVKSKNIQEFAQQIGTILALLTDKCEPRDFEEQAEEKFHEVIKQILSLKSQ